MDKVDRQTDSDLVYKVGEQHLAWSRNSKGWQGDWGAMSGGHKIGNKPRNRREALSGLIGPGVK